MTRSIDDVITWAKANPRYTVKSGTAKGTTTSWAGRCESFINNAGAFAETFASAQIAGDHSGPLNLNWADAPRGAIHYWAGVGGYGHDAFELGGGALLMASGAVTHSWGDALGVVHFTEYARLRLPYRGWTLRHGSETLATPAHLAALNLTALSDEGENDMGFYITQSAAGTKYWVNQSTGTKRSISRPEWSALRAAEAAGGPPLVVATVPKATLAAFPGR